MLYLNSEDVFFCLKVLAELTVLSPHIKSNKRITNAIKAKTVSLISVKSNFRQPVLSSLTNDLDAWRVKVKI